MHRFAPLLVSAALISAAAAQTIVIPNGYAALEGLSANAFPWGRGGTGLYHQCVYDSSHFTLQGVTGPIVITGLKWRPNTAVALVASNYPVPCTVYLSTCPVDHTLITTTIANNQGLNRTHVFSGPVSWAAQAAVPAPGPQPFGISIPCTPTFVYDPTTGGDLNIECDLPIQAFTGSGPQLDVHNGAGQALASRTYLSTGYPGSGIALGVDQNHAVVVEVTYVPAIGLFPSFAATTPRTGASPLAVQFTDLSFSSAPGGVVAWAWDFDGDAIIDSNAQNPSFNFPCGDFSVTLTVTDANGSSNFTRTNYVKTDLLTPDFTATPGIGGVVQFNDTTFPTPTSWAWDFNGDNVTDSVVQNPLWPFGNACGANVKLDVALNCRTGTITKSSIFAPIFHGTAFSATGNSGLTSSGAPSTIGNLFDMEVLSPEGITVCGVTGATFGLVNVPYAVSVYITQDTYVGKDLNAAVWRLVGTGQARMNGGTTAAPSFNPSLMNAPFYLPQGKYGVAVWHTVPAGQTVNQLAYQSVTLATAQGPFANADLVFHPVPAVAPGIARTALFAGTIFQPRQWKGGFHYTKVSLNGLGGYGTHSLGCAGTNGVPRTVPITFPTVGGVLSADFTNLPFGIAIVLGGGIRFNPGIDLGFAGAPGCPLYNLFDLTFIIAGAGTTANLTAPVAPDPTLLGVVYYLQALSLDPALNAFGYSTSDGAGLIIGQ